MLHMFFCESLEQMQNYTVSSHFILRSSGDATDEKKCDLINWAAHFGGGD